MRKLTGSSFVVVLVGGFVAASGCGFTEYDPLGDLLVGCVFSGALLGAGEEPVSSGGSYDALFLELSP